MVVFDVNWIGVIVAAVIGFAIGWAWYSKSLFGKAWMQELGISAAKMKAGSQAMGKIMALGFIGQLVTAFVLANVLALAGATSIPAAIVVAFWVWLGFMVPLLMGAVLWEGKSNRLLSINAGYQLVAAAAMGIVIVLFG